MRSRRIARYRDGWALVFYDDAGKRHRYTLGKVSRREAEASANRIVAQLQQKQRSALTVAEILEMYLGQSEAIGKETLSFHARPVVAGIGDKLAQDAGACVRSYASDRARGVKPGTIRKELGLLRAALNWAPESGGIKIRETTSATASRGAADDQRLQPRCVQRRVR